MIKLENWDVMGFQHAIRGMRNPLNSWHKMDSEWSYANLGDDYITVEYADDCEFQIGPNDAALMMRLAKGGPVHAKYRRMITVYVDITAPLYWWKEFDTYKVGTVANSCSTMHKIHAKEFTLEDFSTEHLTPIGLNVINYTISHLNTYRRFFVDWDKLDGNSKNAVLVHDRKDAWWQMIQLLPSSYNQKRTVMLNYEVLHNIYYSRKNHKLDEWHFFCDWIKSLPYSEVIICNETEEEKNV